MSKMQSCIFMDKIGMSEPFLRTLLIWACVSLMPSAAVLWFLGNEESFVILVFFLLTTFATLLSPLAWPYRHSLFVVLFIPSTTAVLVFYYSALSCGRGLECLGFAVGMGISIVISVVLLVSYGLMHIFRILNSRYLFLIAAIELACMLGAAHFFSPDDIELFISSFIYT